ncbi:MAG: zinc-binding dehydrogenase [SAR202 cluster bacterium]|nr:zinc-binding dehydrogenase [SAR202 cluster bacterium]
MTKFKAAALVEPGKFEIFEFPPVPVQDGGIRVKVKTGGICGSDLHFWRGELKPILSPGAKPGPVVLGHELAGVVEEMGKDISTDSLGQVLQEGDRVVFPYYFPCHRCYNCLKGEFNHCPTRFRFRGSIYDVPYCNGGFAEYFYLWPGHFVFKVPEILSNEVVAGVNCALSQVIYGWKIGGISIGDRVVVQGAGGLGIYATAAAREMGASEVIVIDGQKERLELAKQCGATQTIDINDVPSVESRVECVKDLTMGRGGDIVMEVVGYPQVVNEGIQMVRRGGAYVEVGNIWDNSNVTLDMSKIIWGQVKIIPAAHYTPETLPIALDFLVAIKDKYPLGNIMSNTYPLEKINEAFTESDWLGKKEGSSNMRSFIVME